MTFARARRVFLGHHWVSLGLTTEYQAEQWESRLSMHATRSRIWEKILRRHLIGSTA